MSTLAGPQLAGLQHCFTPSSSVVPLTSLGSSHPVYTQPSPQPLTQKELPHRPLGAAISLLLCPEDFSSLNSSSPDRPSLLGRTMHLLGLQPPPLGGGEVPSVGLISGVPPSRDRSLVLLVIHFLKTVTGPLLSRFMVIYSRRASVGTSYNITTGNKCLHA